MTNRILRAAGSRFTRRIGLLAVVALVAAGTGCGGKSGKSGQRVPKVGLVFDLGGRGDGGFNDEAADGATRASAGGKATVEFADGGEGTQRLDALRRLAKKGSNLVIAVGFLSSKDATIVAREFPGVHFAVIDYSLPVDENGHAMDPPANLAGLNFREEKGAYLVGVMAALTSRSHLVGFIGGMRSPMITKFEVGYAAGVRRVCGNCTLLTEYAGNTPVGFRDPVAGRALALREYGRGADVIFQAAGATGSGVMTAALKSGRFVIGVDVDQASAAPGRVLTSMIKRIDVAVEDVINRERAGTFTAGVNSYGVAEGGIAYVYDGRNAPLIPDAVRMRVETLRAAITAGLITPPAVR
jgi:basic membrane protein A